MSKLTGILVAKFIGASEIFAEGPSVFVADRGIDTFSTGVQTFRAFNRLVAISGNLDHPGGNRHLKKRIPHLPIFDS